MRASSQRTTRGENDAKYVVVVNIDEPVSAMARKQEGNQTGWNGNTFKLRKVMTEKWDENLYFHYRRNQEICYDTVRRRANASMYGGVRKF